MKKVLNFFSLGLLLTFYGEKSDAQCTVSNIVIQNVIVISSTPTTCTVKFDVTFNIENNNGNKYIFVHAWLQNEYPNYFQCVNGQPGNNGSIRAPLAADLGNVFFSIGLNNNGPVPVVLTAYPPDASVNMATMDSSGKIVLPDGSANITLHGVVATAPVPCGTPVVIVADLWSSQSSTAQRAHCVNCGIRYSAGFLNVTGFVNCINLTYSGTITNITNINISGYYRVFADVNGDEHFTPMTDTLLQGNTLFTAAANSSTSISGTVPGANLNQGIFIVVTQTTGAASDASRVFLFRSTQCAPLPVSFLSFTAKRISRTNVVLQWETGTEINNNGFTIMRNTDNNTWDSGSFIPSQAAGGNSNQVLSYSYNDLNATNGITQYRIRQTDIDGRTKFSEIRAVRGEFQKKEMIIYPNPSPNGRVTVVFEEKAVIRDITLSKVTGQLVKQWQGTNSNSLQIENLGTGMYSLVIIARETGNVTVEKIIVLY
jgi:hypothetical protein